MTDHATRKRALVTGGAGFIGSALARALVAAGWSVTVLDKLTYAGSMESLAAVNGAPGYRFIKGDICDGAAVARAFADAQPDTVFHLAAESHVDRSIMGPSDFIDTNVRGTFELLQAARGHWSALAGAAAERFRFVHVSTDEVYGSLGRDGVFTETTPYDPSSPYSASKAAADHFAKAWHRTYGLPVVLTHCSNNYGPFQFPEKLIPVMIINALAQAPLPVYGVGENIRDWLHVDDHVRGLILAAERGRPGEAYNFGGGSEFTNLQLVWKICMLMDRHRPHGAPHDRLITFVEDRLGHDFRYAVDTAKAQADLGWAPDVAFEAGLAETVDWFLANGAWWRARLKAVRGGD